VIGQANNSFVFPGIGLGVIVAEAREITDEMLLAAAEALAATVSADRVGQGAMYPCQSRLREVSWRVAFAVVRAARDCGVGLPLGSEEAARRIDAAMWFPDYISYVPAA
jgi:malate dehydrogenase (oxaloacetate-decarboxylating)